MTSLFKKKLFIIYNYKKKHEHRMNFYQVFYFAVLFRNWAEFMW